MRIVIFLWALALILASGAGFAQSRSELAAAVADLERDFEALMALPASERLAHMAAVQRTLTDDEAREYRRAFKRNREALQTRMQADPELAAYFQSLNAARKGLEPANRPAQSRPKIPGTNIQYDTGTVVGTAGLVSQMLGNRFDSALNAAGTQCCFPVETTGTITRVTFNMVNTFFSSAIFSLYTNVSGTEADQVFSQGIPVSTGLNTHTIGTMTNGAYANGSFLVGFWQFDPSSTAVGVDTASTGGQGFHAISLNDAIVGSALTNVTLGGNGANAIVRVGGNVATPVELLNFSID